MRNDVGECAQFLIAGIQFRGALPHPLLKLLVRFPEGLFRFLKLGYIQRHAEAPENFSLNYDGEHLDKINPAVERCLDNPTFTVECRLIKWKPEIEVFS